MALRNERSQTILILTRSMTMRGLLHLAFSRHRYRVLDTQSPEDVERVINAEDVDLLIVNGDEDWDAKTFRQLRQKLRVGGSPLPMVILCPPGRVNGKLTKTLLLEKPVTQSELLTAVNTLLAGTETCCNPAHGEGTGQKGPKEFRSDALTD